jgi:hypothetical protein
LDLSRPAAAPATVRDTAAIGEIVRAQKDVFGEHRDG